MEENEWREHKILHHTFLVGAHHCEPATITTTAFSQTDLFLAEFISNSDPERNLSDQLQSQSRTNVDMMSTCSREPALFYSYQSMLM